MVLRRMPQPLETAHPFQPAPQADELARVSHPIALNAYDVWTNSCQKAWLPLLREQPCLANALLSHPALSATSMRACEWWKMLLSISIRHCTPIALFKRGNKRKVLVQNMAKCGFDAVIL